uniref:Uncharacterized protein n=1 Tax=Aegilops tauschii subsp. strangulata TaxID=200361 RepID=A0A453QFA6_AEGTS
KYPASPWAELSIHPSSSTSLCFPSFLPRVAVPGALLAEKKCK